MTRADRKNAVLRKKRLNRGVRNYEALSKTRYNSVRISNFGLKFLQYILNILYFRIKQKKNFDFFNPSYQATSLKLCAIATEVATFCIEIFLYQQTRLIFHPNKINNIFFNSRIFRMRILWDFQFFKKLTHIIVSTFQFNISL